MQAIKESDQSVAFTGEIFRFRGGEGHVGDSFFVGKLFGFFYGRCVEIESVELAVGKRFRHDHRGVTVSAPDICYLRSAFEFFLNPIKRRNPRLEQVGLVSGFEKLGDAAEQAGIVIAPGNAMPSFERFCDFRFVSEY